MGKKLHSHSEMNPSTTRDSLTVSEVSVDRVVPDVEAQYAVVRKALWSSIRLVKFLISTPESAASAN
jgi:hypothetical protein